MAPVSSVAPLGEQLTSRATAVADALQLAWEKDPSTAKLVVLAGVTVSGSLYAVSARAFSGLYDYPWQLPGVVLRLSSTVGSTLAKYVARGGKPYLPDWTLPFEIKQAVFRTVFTHYADRVVTSSNAKILRDRSEAVGTSLGEAAARRNGTTMEPFTFNGLEHIWVRAAATPAKPTQRVVVLYFHGGGFMLMSPRMYSPFGSELLVRIRQQLADKLPAGQHAQVDVLLANYRKGPDVSYPHPPQDALAMYFYLLEKERVDPRHIIVMGDSGGGTLTMTTLLRLRDKNPALLPAAAILSCPYVDIAHEGSDTETPHCMLTERVVKRFGQSWFPGEGSPSKWGDASPLYCNLHGLPPAYIQAAGLDHIFVQSQRLLDKAREHGLTDWQLEVFPTMPHVFTTAPLSILPIAAKGIDAMAAYAATQFAKALLATDDTT